MSRIPWWLRYVNKVMVGLPVVLTVSGRKSGRPRSTPVTPMTVDGKRYVVGGFPGSDWAANVRAAGEATLSQGRNSQRVRMVEMSVENARPLLRAFPVEVPSGISFVRNAGLVKDGTPDEFEKLAGTCPVFRLDPVTA